MFTTVRSSARPAYCYPAQDVLKLEFYYEVSPLVKMGVASLAVVVIVGGYFLVNYERGFFSPEKVNF